MLAGIFTPLKSYTALNMQLKGKSEGVELHLYKYWMMLGIEASTGTAIDFISLVS